LVVLPIRCDESQRRTSRTPPPTSLVELYLEIGPDAAEKLHQLWV
jgi:hypothetical protein